MMIWALVLAFLAGVVVGGGICWLIVEDHIRLLRRQLDEWEQFRWRFQGGLQPPTKGDQR